MYFLILDRFANDRFLPNGAWNQRYDYRQGGKFKGLTAQLNYLSGLGVKALWLSPVLKNSRPDSQYTYPGYDTRISCRSMNDSGRTERKRLQNRNSRNSFTRRMRAVFALLSTQCSITLVRSSTIFIKVG